MARYILYLVIAFFSTTIGSLTGMGGGVIIKPSLDMLGQYSVETIGILSAATVLAMSLVSVARQLLRGMRLKLSIALPLAIGSVIGGIVGQRLFSALVASAKNEGMVTIVQNILLALVIICVFIYMAKKDKIKSPKLTGVLPAVLAGMLLGIISSFLGIGGGPINVALIIYLFNFDTKTATVCSLVTILFAQLSKLSGVALTTGFGSFDLSMLPVMIIGAVVGGFLGASLNKRLSDRTVERCFSAVQLLVLAITVFNIISNLI